MSTTSTATCNYKTLRVGVLVANIFALLAALGLNITSSYFDFDYGSNKLLFIAQFFIILGVAISNILIAENSGANYATTCPIATATESNIRSLSIAMSVLTLLSLVAMIADAVKGLKFMRWINTILLIGYIVMTLAMASSANAASIS